MFLSRLLRRSLSILAILAAVGATLDAAPPTGEARLQIFKHADLVVTVPPGWAATPKWGMRRTSPPTMRLTGPGHPLEVLITPLVSNAGDPSFNSPEQVRKSATKTGQQMLADAKETSITLHDLAGAKGQGVYYTLTEKVTPAGAYEYLTNAFIGVGELLVTATILHHEKDSDAFEQALNVLRSIDQPGFTGADKEIAAATGATSKSAAPAPAKAPAPVGTHFDSPDGTWALVVPGNSVVQSRELNKSGTGIRYTAVDKDTVLNVSVVIEPASEPGDSAIARAAYWRKMLVDPVEKHDVHTREEGDKAVVMYTTLEKQQDMNVFMVHRKLWINIHVSKANFAAPNDETLFQSLVTGIGFQDVSHPIKK